MRNRRFLQKWEAWKLTRGNLKDEDRPEGPLWTTMALRDRLWMGSEDHHNEEATRRRVLTKGVGPRQIVDLTTTGTIPKALALRPEQEQCHPT